jgi:hypothetical protein
VPREALPTIIKAGFTFTEEGLQVHTDRRYGCLEISELLLERAFYSISQTPLPWNDPYALFALFTFIVQHGNKGQYQDATIYGYGVCLPRMVWQIIIGHASLRPVREGREIPSIRLTFDDGDITRIYKQWLAWLQDDPERRDPTHA